MIFYFFSSNNSLTFTKNQVMIKEIVDFHKGSKFELNKKKNSSI